MLIFDSIFASGKKSPPSGAPVTWTARTPGFTGTINSVGYGNGLWVAIGASGALMTVANPTQAWSSGSPGWGTYIKPSLAYYNGKWATVSGDNIFGVSDPTGAWTNSYYSHPSTWVGVAYGNGYWVAVGQTGKLRTATDPTSTWTSRTSGFGTTNINGVAYGNGNWVAVGYSGKIYTATDPTGTWSAATSSGFGTNAIYGVGYGNGNWVAVGYLGRIYTATDPTGTWSAAAASGFTHTIQNVAYGNGSWVAVGGSNASFDKLSTAIDPTGTWTSRTSGFGVDDIIKNIACGNNIWVAVGGDTTTLMSTAVPGI